MLVCDCENKGLKDLKEYHFLPCLLGSALIFHSQTNFA